MARPFTGANVLLLIRDGKANDIESLSNEFEFELRSPSEVPGYYRIEAKVKELVRAGLVAIKNGRYEVKNNWRKIQGALDMSLTQISKLGSPSVDSPAIVVEPYFGVTIAWFATTILGT